MKNQKLIRILTYFYLIPFGIMILFNTGNSLLRTTYFELYSYVEAARYKWDMPFLTLAVSAGLIAFFCVLMKSERAKKINERKLAAGSGVTFSLLTVLLFRGVATCDSSFLSDIAIEFLEGNYRAFEQGEYLYRYSFQTGMTALLELIYRIFGIENFIVFQLINTGCILVILRMLNKITEELFEEERICRLEAFLSMGMFPLFLFATFVYGDIIGWAFGISSIYFMIRYLKTDKQWNLLKASLLLSAGIVVKSNINILLVAAVIVVILHAVQKRDFKILLWVAALVVISQAGTAIVNGIYVRRAGLEEFPRGIPKIAWIAMSMQKGDEGGYACGWYNGYNWVVYEENQFDQALTVQACMENLRESLQKFLHEQRYAVDYFYKKFSSQWNAPTFQAMITNEWSSRYVENLSGTARFFIYGGGREFLYGVMNIYHFFLFLCTGVYCLYSRKIWSLERAYFALNIFGGFMFHMIWEAQARYILGYFVLMLPLAAVGLDRIIEMVGRASKKKKEPAGECQ